MAQRASSVHSTISSLSSSSGISLQQIHPVTSTISNHSVSTQQSTNLATGGPSHHPTSANPPSVPSVTTAQAASPPLQANPSQQVASGSSKYCQHNMKTY